MSFEIGSQEFCLNGDEMRDVWEAFHKIPYIMAARDAFIAMVLQAPPVLQMADGGEMAAELRILLELYWVDWLRDCYDWEKQFGIIPWKLESIGVTGHRIPVCPKYNNGRISTVRSANGKQKYRWYPLTNGMSNEHDKSMNFETFGHAPTVDGQLTSPMASMLHEWRTLKVVRQSHEIAAHQQARIQHVFEYHPPRNNVGDDNLLGLEEFGDTIAGNIIGQQERLQHHKIHIRRDDLINAVRQATANNRNYKPKFAAASRPILYSESYGDRWERENESLLERAIPLNPDYAYKAVPAPRVMLDLEQVAKHVYQVGAALMDYPLSAIEGSGSTKTTANLESNMRHINERVKSWTRFFERLVKKVFLLAYGKVLFGDEFKGSAKNVLALYADTRVTVTLQCSPFTPYDAIRQFHMDGLMGKEDMAHHAFANAGLSQDEINVTEYPDKFPKELAKEMQKKALQKTAGQGPTKRTKL
jgi:hypothetical protein